MLVHYYHKIVWFRLRCVYRESWNFFFNKNLLPLEIKSQRSQLSNQNFLYFSCTQRIFCFNSWTLWGTNNEEKHSEGFFFVIIEFSFTSNVEYWIVSSWTELRAWWAKSFRPEILLLKLHWHRNLSGFFELSLRSVSGVEWFYFTSLLHPHKVTTNKEHCLDFNFSGFAAWRKKERLHVSYSKSNMFYSIFFLSALFPLITVHHRGKSHFEASARFCAERAWREMRDE